MTGFYLPGLIEIPQPVWEKSFRVIGILLLSYVTLRFLLMAVEKYRQLAIRNTEDPVLDAQGKRAQTLTAILRNIAIVTVMITMMFILLAEIGINIAPLLAGAGIAGIAIGFGAQSLVKDLFYGFFILAENQFSIGDVIQVGDSTGLVEQMTLRTVLLRDLDGRVHIIPNGEVNKVIVYTKEWSRMNINLEVGYASDIDEVFQVIEQVNKLFYKQHKKLLLETPEILGVESLGANGIEIKVIAKTLPLKQWEISRQYRKAIKEAFDKAGIEIPFPQRTLHLSSVKEPLIAFQTDSPSTES